MEGGKKEFDTMYFVGIILKIEKIPMASSLVRHPAAERIYIQTSDKIAAAATVGDLKK